MLLGIALALSTVMFHPRIRNALIWRVMVTPLASIIGSGFLVIAPLLGTVAGAYSVLAITGIVTLAYAIGAVIRFNIRHTEPILNSDKITPFIQNSERAANIFLTMAYVISVAFYLRLLSSFVLRLGGDKNDLIANIITTSILLFIAITGWTRGLHGLEILEKYSVTIKLAIIGALLTGLIKYGTLNGFTPPEIDAEPMTLIERLRMFGGMLLVVQGFETSRYLGADYKQTIRIRGMWWAQILSALIYIAFIFLVMPLLHFLNGVTPDETAIVSLAGEAAMILPFMLIVAAVMSQFSAAVADTIGAGGLVQEETNNRIKTHTAYVLITGLAIALVWSVNIFEIVSLASRAFAAYYATQCLIALKVWTGPMRGRSFSFRTLFLILMMVLLTLIALFAIPVG